MKTIKQVAEKYGVTTMAVRHWINDGGIETKWEKKIGVRRRLIVSGKEIDNYLKSRGEPRE